MSRRKRVREISRTPQQTEVEKARDGAYYHPPAAVPSDYYSDPETKLRPNFKTLPAGKATIRLDGNFGVANITVPPRTIWKLGSWGGNDPKLISYRTWVVSGEGTPGNFVEREYVLPQEMQAHQIPPHPADWPESLRKPPTKKKEPDFKQPHEDAFTFLGSAPKQQQPSLPWGVKVICPGCGHYFKMDDLTTHSKQGICPAQQGDLVMFVMECACHKDDLQASAKIMPGFPKIEQAKEKAQPASDEEATRGVPAS